MDTFAPKFWLRGSQAGVTRGWHHVGGGVCVICNFQRRKSFLTAIDSTTQIAENPRMKAFKTFMVILVVFLIFAAAFIAVIQRIPHWSAQTATLSSTTIAGTVVRKDEALVKLNSWSGTAYVYDNGVWKHIATSNDVVKLEPSLIEKVTGQGYFTDDGTFQASIYNGTGWRIKSAMLDLSVTCTNHDNNFKRNYYQVTDIAPYSESRIVFTVSKPFDLDKFTWDFSALYGLQEIQPDNNQQ